MNKALKTISIIAVIVLAVGIGLSILGFVLGGANSIYLEKGKFRVINSMDEDEMDIIDETYSNVKNVKIDIDTFSKVVFKEGDSFSVKGRNLRVMGGIEAIQQGETLSIQNKNKGQIFLIDFGFFNRIGIKNNEDLEITYPANTTLNHVEVNIDLGDMEVIGLNAKKIDMELDMGNLNIKESKADSISLDLNLGDCELRDTEFRDADISIDTGNLKAFNFVSDGLEIVNSLGDVNIEGILNGKSEFDMDAGNIKLDLDQYEDDTSLSIESDLGTTVINGQKSGGSVENKIAGAKNSIKIVSDLGDIRINFK